jgi:AcrR family transcriptional regulator
VARPRTFDIDSALDIATDMFWRRGYDGTSIADLTKAIGISAPSFYFAFGSKDAAFRRITETYLTRQDEVIETAFGKPEARLVVEALLLGFVDFLTDPEHAPGCLILNNSLPIGEDHPFRAEWAEGRRALRERLAERFRKDRRADRGFPSDWDPAQTARLVVSLIWGIAVEAHSGASGPELRRMVVQFLKTWP